jgi:hypothetical protein
MKCKDRLCINLCFHIFNTKVNVQINLPQQHEKKTAMAMFAEMLVNTKH